MCVCVIEIALWIGLLFGHLVVGRVLCEKMGSILWRIWVPYCGECGVHIVENMGSIFLENMGSILRDTSA